MSNGKGDKRRPENRKRREANYAAIKWTTTRKARKKKERTA